MASLGIPTTRSNHPGRAMDSRSDSAARILEIEARQDDALGQLEALERRVEAVLAEYVPMLAKVPPRCESAASRARAEISPPAVKAA